MTNHELRIAKTIGITLGLAGLAVGMVGCGSEEPDVSAPVTRRAAPSGTTAPQVSRVVPVAELVAQLGIDDRIDLPEDKAPDSTDERKAVLEFFDALARGDDATFGGMITDADKYELQRLKEAGEWSETTANIDEIMVETGKSPLGLKCALAIIETGDNYQPQLWYYTKESDGFLFEAASSPPDIMNRLYGVNPIKVWHDIIAEEEELATKPDEEIQPFQVVVGEGGSRSGGGGPISDNAPGQRNPGLDQPIKAPGQGVPGPTPGGG